MIILAIALAPALTVFLVAALSRSKGWTNCAAAIAALIGICTGNPAYTVFDLAVLGVVYWFSLQGLKNLKGGPANGGSAQRDERGYATPMVTPVVARPLASKSGLSVGSVIGFAMFGGLALVAIIALVQPTQGSIQQPNLQAHTAPQPSDVSPTKVAITEPRTRPAKITKPTRTAAAVREPKKAASPVINMDDCLTIPSDAGMARCFEQAAR